jgi:hypothetical protein
MHLRGPLQDLVLLVISYAAAQNELSHYLIITLAKHLSHFIEKAFIRFFRLWFEVG